MILRRHETKEIERNLPGVDFGIKKMRKLFQEGGKVPPEIILIRIERRADRASSSTCWIVLKSILSRPGDDFVLHDLMAIVVLIE